jgi:AcrR family transcriptional regulator
MAKRTSQTDRTRTAIIDAATEMVFGSTRPEDFTMQTLADAAGVSHRTLYRYFSTRKELFNAVGAEFDRRLDASVGVDTLASFDHWVSNVSAVMAFGAAHSDVFRRTLALSVTTGEWRSDRDEAYWELFRENFPNLKESEARQDFAVLRHVLWSANAVLIRQRFDLTVEEMTAGVERAVAAMLAEIERRDAEMETKGDGS